MGRTKMKKIKIGEVITRKYAHPTKKLCHQELEVSSHPAHPRAKNDKNPYKGSVSCPNYLPSRTMLC
uniref:Monoglyceride lipase n=1 Tax=Solanum tuberosum TaxID=4113 RepID=M1C8K3_SOLTU